MLMMGHYPPNIVSGRSDGGALDANMGSSMSRCNLVTLFIRMKATGGMP